MFENLSDLSAQDQKFLADQEFLRLQKYHGILQNCDFSAICKKSKNKNYK